MWMQRAWRADAGEGAGGPGRAVRVLIVDNDDSTRAGLAYYLREVESGVDVVGEACDGETAIEQALALHPDLVVMDARMPGMSGFAAARTIRDELPDTQVVIFSLFDDEFARADAERAGALALVAKTDLAGLDAVVAGVRERLPD